MKMDERELTAARIDSVTPDISSIPSRASWTRTSSSAGGLVAEAGTVGRVGLVALAVPRDPVRHGAPDDRVVDHELDRVRLGGRDAHRHAAQVAVLLERRPAALPRELGPIDEVLAHGGVGG